MACGGTEIELSKINLECVLCEKQKKRTAPLPATAVVDDTSVTRGPPSWSMSFAKDPLL